MKKYILPVILLAMLSGCGKVKDTNSDTSTITVVSGTAEITTDGSTTETETSEVPETSEKTTTTKTAGEKISVTTTASETTKKSNSQVVTKAQGGSSGGVHGTTRSVPSAPRTTTTASSTTSSQQPTTNNTPSYDPKDYKSVTLEFDDSKPNKLEVLRAYSDGKERKYQTITVDTSEIEETIKKDSTKSISDFIVKADYDNDGYPDLFVIEKEDELNKTGKYFRYDPDTGTYTAWSELNALKFEIKVDTATKQLSVCDKKEDKVEYEKNTYEWNTQKQLVIREYIHQYTASDGDILIDYVNYDENGVETSRETRDSEGRLISGYEEPTTIVTTTTHVEEHTTIPVSTNTMSR